jgi:hypothetical protein
VTKSPVHRMITALTASILWLSGCAPATASVPPVATQAAAAVATTPPTVGPEPTVDPFPGWKAYANPAFGISLRFPPTWYGPDVYEFEDGVRLAVGSDVVYPYGTGPEDRQPGALDAYAVVIQYTVNSAGWTLEQARAEQPWINDSLAILELQDGESSTTARSLTTRVRGLTLGRFSGVEFITTLSDTAQTERFYSRSAFLMDESGNILQIMGSPENVEVTDAANWREAFEAVDEANREIWNGLLDSIRVE